MVEDGEVWIIWLNIIKDDFKIMIDIIDCKILAPEIPPPGVPDGFPATSTRSLGVPLPPAPRNGSGKI